MARMQEAGPDAGQKAMNLLSIEQAAEFFGCHPDTVRHWAAAGKIRGAKIGKAWRFKQSDLDRYFEAQACRSTGVEIPGGFRLSTGGIELDAVLGPRRRHLPSASTTNLKLVSGPKSKSGEPQTTPSRHGSKNGRAERATSECCASSATPTKTGR